MSHSEYLSSPKVIFSDKGSITFGFLIILAMVALSLILFICKFQKQTPKSLLRPPSQNKYSKTLLFLKHPHLFQSSKFNYLLFFVNSKRFNPANQKEKVLKKASLPSHSAS